jgi:threonine synthase
MEHFKPLIEGMKDKIILRAKHLKKEMDEFTFNELLDHPTMSYQDAVNTFLLLKFAEIKEWESNKIQADDLREWHDSQFK